MEDRLLAKTIEESLEQKIDRINHALQNTIQELDVSSLHPRNPSMISYMHSFTGSYCNFEWLDNEAEVSAAVKLPEGVEENLELVLIHLDRTQMLVEDFWADSMRRQLSSKNTADDSESYIQKLEQENKDLRAGIASTRPNVVLNLRRDTRLDQERKNFEEKLQELDFLTCTYKTKHQQISRLEESLRIKERLLEQKEKELRKEKSDMDRAKGNWEKSIVMSTVRNSEFENKGIKGGFNLNEMIVVEEAPPPSLVSAPNKVKQLEDYQQELVYLEVKFKNAMNSDDRSKIVTQIDQTKNKISALRGENAMLQCCKSSKLIKNMRETMEKEVNYEENLRKINLEKFTVKGTNKIGEKYSTTPKCSSLGSKRFLFSDD